MSFVCGHSRPTPRRPEPGAFLCLLSLGAVACGGVPTGTGPGGTEVAAVSVTPNPAAVAVGESIQLVATLLDANGDTLTGHPVTWTSANAALAGVSNSGSVSGVAEGTGNITATSGGKSGSATLTVTAPLPAGFPRFGHVFIVMEENSNYASVIGNAQMPYLNGLATEYGLARSEEHT